MNDAGEMEKVKKSVFPIAQLQQQHGASTDWTNHGMGIRCYSTSDKTSEEMFENLTCFHFLDPEEQWLKIYVSKL